MDTNGLGVKGRHETLLRGRLSPLRRVIRRMVRHTTHSVSFRPGSQLQGSSQSPARRLAGPATVAAIASLVAFIFPGVGVDTCPGFEVRCVLWSLGGWECEERKLGGEGSIGELSQRCYSHPVVHPSIHPSMAYLKLLLDCGRPDVQDGYYKAKQSARHGPKMCWRHVKPGKGFGWCTLLGYFMISSRQRVPSLEKDVWVCSCVHRSQPAIHVAMVTRET